MYFVIFLRYLLFALARNRSFSPMQTMSYVCRKEEIKERIFMIIFSSEIQRNVERYGTGVPGTYCSYCTGILFEIDYSRWREQGTRILEAHKPTRVANETSREVEGS
jgi:hypothetical protein